MALFDALIDDMASRFGLGSNSAPLVRETLALIVRADGGIAGFVGLFKRVGLGAIAESWLGRANPAALPTGDVEKAIGAPAIDAIAHRLGIAMPATSAALAYALPKFVGLLTPHGAVPTALPSEVTAFLGPLASSASSGGDHDHGGEIKQIRARPVAPIWLWPFVAMALVLGLGWAVWPILFPGKSAEATTRETTAPAPAVMEAPKPVPAPSVPSSLSIANDNGVAVFSGAVRDEQTRASILDALRGAFGHDNIKGDMAVEANRSDAPWLPNVRAALAALKIPGVRAMFEGASVNVGGAIVDADRQKITASLKSLLGDGLTIGAISDAFFGAEANANAKAAAAVATLKAGVSGGDLVATLNRIVVNFPYSEANLPGSVQGLLGDVAAKLKTLPPGAEIEIAGYTDNSGDANANVALSQRRAEAIRDALVKAGARSEGLVAKGYGGADPIASNDSEDGRFRNRRIEYHLHNQPTASVAEATPVAAPIAPSPSTLSIDDQDGVAKVSGAVPDEASRSSILEALWAVFGADNVKGDIAVDGGRAPAPWFANLRAALEALKIPGLKATFDGAAIKLGGAIPEADRDKIAASLGSIFGGGVTFGSLVPSIADWTSSANQKAAAALGALKSGYSAADVVTALNLSIVNFATGSAVVPETVMGLLRDAATTLKTLPPGYAIEIAGYTDNTGDPDANLTLSRQRAEAVRDALVKSGAPAGLLTAKGYGAADPVDSNDTEEGRFRNRRIAYRLAKTP